MFSAEDHLYMQMALDLAKQGLYTTTPNPRVGCVIVKDGQIISQGYHERAGQAHAEVMALNLAQGKARGATLYVTLEPCNHIGRTAACVDAIIRAKVAKVVVAMVDPNPKVAGSGLTALENAGINTVCGVLEASARALNRGFIQRMVHNRPWVRLKVGASLDGKTALASGESRWITSNAARQDVQRWRAQSCAILTGIGTILADNPLLTVRDFDIGRMPLRVIVDTHLRIPINAAILEVAPVLIVTLNDNDKIISALRKKNVEVIVFKGDKIDLVALMTRLAERECNEVLVESGMTLNGALLSANLVDEIILYQAPILLGRGARDVMDIELNTLDDKIVAYKQDVSWVGPDLRWILQLKDQ